jgi:DDE superfamily endonuclease
VAERLQLRRQRENALLYVRGLVEQSGRKSLQPTLFRLQETPARYESVQQFLADSPWDPTLLVRAYAERVASGLGVLAWVVDDTGIVKDGKHSPGVKRQWSGTLGKIDNCQVTVSVHAVGTRGTLPVGWRLLSAGGMVRRSAAAQGEDPGRGRLPSGRSRSSPPRWPTRRRAGRSRPRRFSRAASACNGSCLRSGRATVRGRPVAPWRARTAKLVSGRRRRRSARPRARIRGLVELLVGEGPGPWWRLGDALGSPVELLFADFLLVERFLEGLLERVGSFFGLVENVF